MTRMIARRKLWLVDVRVLQEDLHRCIDVGMFAPEPVGVNRNPPRATDSPEVEVTYLTKARYSRAAVDTVRYWVEQHLVVRVYAARARPARTVK